MNSDQALDILDAIAATSSRNAKQALLAEHVEDPFFQWVLVSAYNPYFIYGILPVGGEVGGGQDDFDAAGVASLLNRFMARDLTGQAARDALNDTFAVLSPKSADLLCRILRKDLRAGFSEGSCNKAKKGLIPEFAYMRCSLPKDTKLKEWPWEQGVISQEKADGMFANGNLDHTGEFLFISRQGSIFPMGEFEELAVEMRTTMQLGYQYHGEILVKRDGVILDREIGNGILNSVLKGGSFGPGEKPYYVMWDMVPLEAIQAGKHNLPYSRRLTAIVQAIKLKQRQVQCIGVIPTKIFNTLRHALEHCKELVAQGKEGTIIKKPAMQWKDGTSKDQVKLKLEADCDLIVTEIVPGRIGTKNEGRPGSLRCTTSDGLLVVDVTVKNEAMRDAVEANPDEWIGKVIAVIFNDVLSPSDSNPNYSLFLPRMAEAAYRTDKSVADDLQRVRAALDSAIDKQIELLLND